jgi:glucoamylase
MPLAWAHGEFVKLAASSAQGRPFDRLDGVWHRYGGARPDPASWVWTPGAPIASVPTGKARWLVLPKPVSLHLGLDGWRQVRDRDSEALGLGLHGLCLSAEELAGHTSLQITWRLRDGGSWLGEDFEVRIAAH